MTHYTDESHIVLHAYPDRDMRAQSDGRCRAPLAASQAGDLNGILAGTGLTTSRGGEDFPNETTRKLSVLIVEDDVDTAESLRMLLNLSGYEAHIAGTVHQAISIAASANPDVVLLDLHLPDGDGCEVARRVREMPAMRRPLLVALTGDGRDDDRLATHLAGVDIHLVKPADPEALVKLLDRFSRVVSPV